MGREKLSIGRMARAVVRGLLFWPTATAFWLGRGLCALHCPCHAIEMSPETDRVRVQDAVRP